MNLHFNLLALLLIAVMVSFSACKFGKQDSSSRDVKADLQLVDREVTADNNTPAPETLTEAQPGFRQEPSRS